MNLTEIIESVNQASTDKELNDMVVDWIRLAHQIGFEEGVKHATEIQRKVFEVMELNNH